MPSRSEKYLDRCDVYPSWPFLSKTKKAKHRLFHFKHKIPKSKKEKKSKANKCIYKENGIQCNDVFSSYHKLKEHTDLAQHKRSRSLNKVSQQAQLFQYKSFSEIM